jgi:hypothetical protein
MPNFFIAFGLFILACLPCRVFPTQGVDASGASPSFQSISAKAFFADKPINFGASCALGVPLAALDASIIVLDFHVQSDHASLRLT